MRRVLPILRIVAPPIVIGVSAALLIRLLLVQGFAIPSASMAPTLEIGDHILVARFHPRIGWPSPRRGDVVVFRLGEDAPYFVKRIVATGGEKIEIRDGRVLIDDHTLAEPYLAGSTTPGCVPQERVPAESLFVLGDNRSDSVDSRTRGFVREERLVGKALLVYWSTPGGGATPRVRWARLLRIIE
jgi:signal peptidase I